ncbi:SagB family peptide dehydrogenase [candidate division WOR-3 bacterium]|nr:SagB family peptide dehydrogenase [candidate division WOR-3 bacterium]
MRYLTIEEYKNILAGVPADVDDKVGEFFWQNTKFTPSHGRILHMHIAYLSASPYFVRRFLSPFKVCDGVPWIGLDIPSLPDTSLTQTLAKRRSPAQGKDTILPFQILSAILHYSYGVTAKKSHRMKNEWGVETDVVQSFRPIPSAGGLYPLEIYVAALRVAQLEPAVYHYNAFDSRLERIFGPVPLASMEGRLERKLPGARPTTWLACILITAIPKRQEIKYFSRAYRYILQESGHLAQNICLVAASCGYGILPIGGFDEDAFGEELGASFPEEFVVYPLLLAEPAEAQADEHTEKML